ncbi:hypothetical protein ACFPZ0_12705 [Streptomonospora nanhaiensis]|uniref:hypothetical protein n=1 Tax=Streptomonospora nanhaiensis TaxID=1323731 RepID=UPI001C993E4D|nr:hypothetical protein [Streptomonospora nanhaiensis]MBX9388717.1 hypothetical protein [Streptomonospora nanhaiensis]
MGANELEIAAEVHALVDGLLPVALPNASFDRAASRVVLPFGPTTLRASTWDLLERCAAAPRERWPGLVDTWLRETADLAAMAVAEIELLGDVRRLLRVRVVPAMDGDRRRELVWHPVGPHFDALVMVAHPTYGAPLSWHRARLLQLGRLGRAVRYTLERELADVVVYDRPLRSGHDVRVVTKPGSPYVTLLLTELRRYVPPALPCGALVGAPRYDTLLVHPVTSRAAVEALPALAAEVAALHAAADDPCSPEVFWWRGGDPEALDPRRGRRDLKRALKGAGMWRPPRRRG